MTASVFSASVFLVSVFLTSVFLASVFLASGLLGFAGGEVFLLVARLERRPELSPVFLAALALSLTAASGRGDPESRVTSATEMLPDTVSEASEEVSDSCLKRDREQLTHRLS